MLITDMPQARREILFLFFFQTGEGQVQISISIQNSLRALEWREKHLANMLRNDRVEPPSVIPECR